MSTTQRPNIAQLAFDDAFTPTLHAHMSAQPAAFQLQATLSQSALTVDGGIDHEQA